MKIWIYTVGKMKTPGLRDSADHYLRLISKFSEVGELELKGVKVSGKTGSDRQKVQIEEQKILLEALSKRQPYALVLLDEKGRASKTSEWAQLIEKYKNTSTRNLVFCVGGSLGFTDELRKRANLVLSLGPQTLAHELARVVLLEQVFRALSVIAGHPYHHEG